MTTSGEVLEFRYIRQLVITSIFPVALVVFGLYTLFNYSDTYPGHFRIEPVPIVLGLLFGIIPFLIIFRGMLSKARNIDEYGNDHGYQRVQLELTNMFFIFVPFVVVFAILALLVNLQLAWQFAIGFFAAVPLYPLAVFGFEQLRRVRLFILVEEVGDGESVKYFDVRKRYF